MMTVASGCVSLLCEAADVGVFGLFVVLAAGVGCTGYVPVTEPPTKRLCWFRAVIIVLDASPVADGVPSPANKKAVAFIKVCVSCRVPFPLTSVGACTQPCSVNDLRAVFKSIQRPHGKGPTSS